MQAGSVPGGPREGESTREGHGHREEPFSCGPQPCLNCWGHDAPRSIVWAIQDNSLNTRLWIDALYGTASPVDPLWWSAQLLWLTHLRMGPKVTWASLFSYGLGLCSSEIFPNCDHFWMVTANQLVSSSQNKTLRLHYWLQIDNRIFQCMGKGGHFWKRERELQGWKSVVYKGRCCLFNFIKLCY